MRRALVVALQVEIALALLRDDWAQHGDIDYQSLPLLVHAINARRIIQPLADAGERAELSGCSKQGSRPFRPINCMSRDLSAYEVGEERSASSDILSHPSLLTAFASKRGVSVARTELELRQVGINALFALWAASSNSLTCPHPPLQELAAPLPLPLHPSGQPAGGAGLEAEPAQAPLPLQPDAQVAQAVDPYELDLADEQPQQ